MQLFTGLVLFICAASFACVLAKPHDSDDYDDDDDDGRRTERWARFILKIDQELNWNEAMNACSGENTSLASIRGRNEQTKVLSTITRNGEAKGSFWVSGKFILNRFNWFVTTPDDQWFEKFTYTNWMSKEPKLGKDKSEMCVLISPPFYSWRTAKCSEAHNFMCEQNV